MTDEKAVELLSHSETDSSQAELLESQNERKLRAQLPACCKRGSRCYSCESVAMFLVARKSYIFNVVAAIIGIILSVYTSAEINRLRVSLDVAQLRLETERKRLC